MDEEGKEIKMEMSAFPNFDFLDSEIYDDSSYPLSLPSQPPDIRNWISSYESEQSADSNEGPYFHHSHELHETETQDPFEDSRKRKLQEICLSPEKEQPDLSKDTFARNFTLNSTMEIFRMNSTGTDSVVAKKKQSLRNILGEEFLTNCQKTIIDQSISPEMDKIDPRSDMLEGKTCKENIEKKCQEQKSNNSEQKKEDQIPHTEEKPHESTRKADFISPKFRPKLHGNQENESKNRGNFDKDRDGCFSANKTNFSVDAVPTQGLSSGKILGEEFLMNCQKTIIDQSISPEMDNIDPRSDMLEGKTCKENLEKKCQEQKSNNSEQKKEDQIPHTEEKPHESTSKADFISPKSRPKLHGNQENKSKNRGNFDKDGDGGFSVNKTDFSVDAVPTQELSSGKWQCPRKRKPYVGPPLKQLRLEQWINRAS